MLILGIVCSPRLGGNTEILVREALEGAASKGAEVNIVTLAHKQLNPCDHCGACYDGGICHFEDDMKDIYRQLIEADGIILGSPVYFWSVTAQAKIVMDRTYALRHPIKRLTGKIGGAVAVAGRRGQLEALTLINNFYLGQGILPVHLGVDGRGSKKGEVREDAQAMAGAKLLGERMVDLIAEKKVD
ncbi:MAG: flavodoxin family protein [Candidatus Bathyarchaeota archaeon]|nr:MAG: flavodoxin family protein [Candidatus Bathyarchaeota archaeon]